MFSAWLAACTATAPVAPLQAPALHDDIRAREQRVERLRAEGDHVSAERQLHVLTLLAPGEARYRSELDAVRAAIAAEADEQLQKGLAAYRRGDADAAATALLRALALKPQNAEAAAALREIEKSRMIRLQTGRAAKVRPEARLPSPTETKPAANKSMNEGNARGFEIEQGLELFKAGDQAGGLREMRRYLAANPKDGATRKRFSEAVAQKALDLEQRGQAEQALNLYQQAAAAGLPPADTARVQALRKRLGAAYYEKGQRIYRQNVDEAIRLWETSLRFDPQNGASAGKLREARRLQQNLKNIPQQKPR